MIKISLPYQNLSKLHMGKRVRIFRNYCFCYLKKKKRKVKKLLQVLIAERNDEIRDGIFGL